jgi:hypothetical protein
MIHLRTNLGIFWSALEWKIYFTAIWNILWPFGIIYDHYNVYIVYNNIILYGHFVHLLYFYKFWAWPCDPNTTCRAYTYICPKNKMVEIAVHT